MTFSRPRQIALCDALIWVAIFAAAMASLRVTWSELNIGGYLRHSPHSPTHGPPRMLAFLEYPYNRALVNGVPLLAVASLAHVCLTIRPRRSAVAKLVRQPGLALSLTVVTVAAATFVGLRIPHELREIADIRFNDHIRSHHERRTRGALYAGTAQGHRPLHASAVGCGFIWPPRCGALGGSSFSRALSVVLGKPADHVGLRALSIWLTPSGRPRRRTHSSAPAARMGPQEAPVLSINSSAATAPGTGSSWASDAPLRIRAA